MTNTLEILILSDKSISEFDDEYLFMNKVQSISQFTINGEWFVSLLFDKKDRLAIKEIINKLFGSSQNFQIKNVENRNWVLESQKSLKPISFQNIYVHNNSYPKNKYKKINICINEGLAFGTGHHETTSGCVNALIEIRKTTNIRSFLDIGTGSGLLTIVANKLWKCRGIGVDNDSKSIEVSRYNFDENNCKNEVCARNLDITKESYKLNGAAKFDLIMVNILANVVEAVKCDLAKLVSNKGILILSGFTNKQKIKIKIIYQNLGFILIREHVIGNWVTLVLKARSVQL